MLAGMVDGHRPGHLWALAVLHRHGHPVRPRWEALGAPRVELPGVPDDVRRAIVRQYAPGQSGSDPRWLLELACQPVAPPPDPERLLSRATEALDAAGLQPGRPVSAQESWGTGSGTYHTVGTAAGSVLLSTLGPFFSLEDDSDERPVRALCAVGFRHVDGDLGATRVDGLHVYYFGDREPLTVSGLLFYWQD